MWRYIRNLFKKDEWEYGYITNGTISRRRKYKKEVFLLLRPDKSENGKIISGWLPSHPSWWEGFVPDDNIVWFGHSIDGSRLLKVKDINKEVKAIMWNIKIEQVD